MADALVSEKTILRLPFAIDFVQDESGDSIWAGFSHVLPVVGTRVLLDDNDWQVVDVVIVVADDRVVCRVSSGIR